MDNKHYLVIHIDEADVCTSASFTANPSLDTAELQRIAEDTVRAASGLDEASLNHMLLVTGDRVVDDWFYE